MKTQILNDSERGCVEDQPQRDRAGRFVQIHRAGFQWRALRLVFDTAAVRLAKARISRLVRCAGLLVLIGSTGCRATRPLPAANLNEPGWTVRSGQAVWRLPHGQREIAGEVMVATRGPERSFVQFSKDPFPLMIGQTIPGQWEVEFPPQNKRYSGRGAPPARIIWLQLPLVLSGRSPPAKWSWHIDANDWRLENHGNGESIAGYFSQ